MTQLRAWWIFPKDHKELSVLVFARHRSKALLLGWEDLLPCPILDVKARRAPEYDSYAISSGEEGVAAPCDGKPIALNAITTQLQSTQ